MVDIWARAAGWRLRHTTREATRAFPMPGMTPLPSPSPSCRPSPSFFCNLCDAHIFTFPWYRRQPRNSFPCAYEPDVIVRFFSLSQTVSVVSHKKRNRKFMTVLGTFGPLCWFSSYFHISQMGNKNYSNPEKVVICSAKICRIFSRRF